MLPFFDDITSRITEKPSWYDSNGVPRYGKFNPEMCGVYAKYIAYMEIACQSCDKRFEVASEVDMMSVREPVRPTLAGKSSAWHCIGSFHYGDPPAHGCIGDTMNSIPIRVIEFWEKGFRTKVEQVHDALTDQRYHFEWGRDPECEITLPKEEE